jgi:hypothetical protein
MRKVLAIPMCSPRFFDFQPDFEIPKVIRALEDLLTHLDDGRLDDAHKHYFLTVALHRIVNKLRGHRNLADSTLVAIHSVFRLIIVVVIKHIHGNHPSLLELLASLFALDSALYSTRTMPERYKYIPDPEIFAVSRRNRRLIITKPSALQKLRLGSDIRHGRLTKAKQPLEDHEDFNDRIYNLHPGVRRPSYLLTEPDSIMAAHLEALSASDNSDDGDTVEFDSETSDSDTEEEFGAGVAPRKEKVATFGQLLDQAEAEAAPYSVSAYRVMHGAEWVVDSVNFFGFNGGFTEIVKHLVSPQCTFPYASSLLQFWAHLTDEGLLVSPRGQRLVMATELHFLPRITRMDAQDVRGTKKEDIEAILKHMGTLFRGLGVNSKKVSRVLEPLYMAALKQFMLLAPIDKRVQALQQFISIVESAQNFEQSMRMSSRAGIDDFPDYSMGAHQRSGPIKNMSTAEIAQWIRDNDVIEGIFSPSRHAQVVSKSLPLVRFLATSHFQMDDGSSASYLRSTALDAIWNCATTTSEAAVADDSFALLTTIAPLLHPTQLDQVVSLAAERISSATDARLVNLCSHFARVARDTNHRLRMLDALWNVSVQESVEVEQSSLASTQLIESLKVDTCARFRRGILTRAVQHVHQRSNKSNAIAMKVAHGVLNISPSLAVDAPGSPRGESVAELIFIMQQEYNLIGMLVIEFTKWHERNTAAVAAAPADSFTNTSVIDGRLPYQEELKARLELLFVCLSHSQRLGPEFRALVTVVPTQIWESAVEGALFTEARNEAFLWFQCCRNTSSSGLQPVTATVAQHLFEKMLKLDHSSDKYATLSFFKCFQKYFLDVNGALGKISVLPVSAGAPPTEISVLSSPSDLQGVSVFWTLAIDSADAAVVDVAIDFLLKLTEKALISPITGLTKWSIREIYIQQCLKYLYECVHQAVKSPRFLTDLARRRVLRCLKLMQSILDLVEPAINAEPTKTRAAPVSLRVRVVLDTSQTSSFDFIVDGDNNTPFKVIYQRVLLNMQSQLEKHGVDGSDLLLVDPNRPGVTLDLHGDDEAFTLKSLEEIGLEDR